VSELPPLGGIRVLDFTRFLAGPFCTMQLGDLGADVVKVEPPAEAREFSTKEGADTYFFLSANRSKRSLALDLHHEAGRDLLLRLLPQFDILVENSRPGVMDRRGLGPETALRIHPQLIYVSISGYGASGPYRERPGFDQIAQGMSGVMSLTGTSQTGPLRHGLAIGDLIAGLFAARTGRGQHVETSLLEGLIGILSWGAGMFFEAGEAPGVAGHHHPLASPYGRFRAADGYLNIAAGNQSMWEKLCRELGREEWKADARFADAGARLRNRDALTEEIDAALAGASVSEWVERINAAGVPCGPIYSLDQVFADPQVLAREMRVEMPHPARGTFKTTGVPIKFSRNPARIERRPPLLAEHTDEILDELGVAAEERDALRRSGILR
jgi:formyl-CoA transferase/CoA:oxalate CoA-transferase